jgi:hypothetical protein
LIACIFCSAIAFERGNVTVIFGCHGENYSITSCRRFGKAPCDPQDFPDSVLTLALHDAQKSDELTPLQTIR